VATHCSKFYAPWVRALAVASGAPVVAHLHNATQTADGPESPFWSRLFLGSCRHVIAVSPAVAAYAAQVAPALAERIDVIRNGIDPGEFDGVTAEQREGAYLLAVGRLSAQKGFDVLLDALGRMERPPPLVIAGSGPDATSLAAQADRLGLVSRVTLLGEVPRERVKSLLAGAGVVVMPSRFEGNPLIALEAMQAGAPLVASDIPGLPPELVDGVTGVLVPPDDSAALAAALGRLVHDPAAALALGRGAKEAARAIPSWGEVAARVAAIYAGAAGPSSPARPQTRS
jgi:glycosyltransferase involved in cell wall biosynthesis